MKTSTYNSWWREMGAISRGMMFIEGNIATPASLDRIGQDGRADAPAARPSSQSDVRPEPSPARKRKTFSLYEDLLFLGGRPMTSGHNDDLDEPFPQTFAEPKDRTHRFGARRQAPQPQHCATC
ncbi:hypothetical protein CSC74_16885 [Pseudoxanthomonas yeongjuensis]|uniref:hypothetical protein n=1 Tax=Pseudoxanthomonas yeongjuensis TaxID=377616 RepID=UPI0013920BB6|nr:hypothetical protein [Pseudoxanthomonas yeongjuensis]KAF1713769.1 hypothetical protein CSC74_16885 [Pseudoxanthomonas yeongjuensis]